MGQVPAWTCLVQFGWMAQSAPVRELWEVGDGMERWERGGTKFCLAAAAASQVEGTASCRTSS